MNPLPRFQYHPTSEQIRWALGLLTPAELDARARREAEQVERQALQAAKGVPLFDQEPS